MLLKMRENSLFARLLRSPWWVSILIGAAISLAVPALFAPQYAQYGVVVAIPFFVIGLIRAYRQLKEPSGRDIAQTAETIRGMSPREFSATLTAAFTADGYVVTPVKGNGADLKLESDGQVTLVSCRRFKAANSGVKPLQALVSAGESQEAPQLIFVTIVDVTKEADDYAFDHKIEIPSLESLTKLVGAQLKESAP